jgi:hypothetical protein
MFSAELRIPGHLGAYQDAEFQTVLKPFFEAGKAAFCNKNS